MASVASISERYVPWVRDRWLRDHAELLHELIQSEQSAAKWVLPRWRRIWNAASDRMIAASFLVVATVTAAVLGALALSALGIPR